MHAVAFKQAEDSAWYAQSECKRYRISYAASEGDSFVYTAWHKAGDRWQPLGYVDSSKKAKQLANDHANGILAAKA